MSRSPISLADKQRWMRERRAPAEPLPAEDRFGERHYSVAQIAELWGLSRDAVRRLFEHEPGVLVLGSKQGGTKRRYATLRVPESVLRRMHRRRTNPGL